jgi:hypothetical protein
METVSGGMCSLRLLVHSGFLLAFSFGRLNDTSDKEGS